MHLRIGSSGNAGGRAQHGRGNCDVVYLFAAKSGKALTDKEIEHCATLEFDIKRGVDGDKRNLQDGFARQDILAEMRPLIQKRIEELRGAETFYFRTANLNIDPFDFATKTFQMRANWYGSFVGDPITAMYRFKGQGFFDPANPNWWLFKLRSDESEARLIEGARMRSGGIPVALNSVFFKVSGAEEAPQAGRSLRTLAVEVQHFNFSVRDKDGQVISKGITLAK